MRLMLGLDRGEGRTTFDGRTFAELEQPMRHVGALLEAKPFHPTRQARHHLQMLAVANRIERRRVDEVLELVGLTSVAKGRPKKFSLGMGQRLGIAAALLGDPHTLVLDEPSNGLDPQGITWLRQLLRHLAGEGRSVFVSSHLLQEMALLADELVVVGRGRLLANGPVSDFVEHGAAVQVVLRTPDLAVLGPAIVAAGGTLTADAEGAQVVTGLDAVRIGDLAHEHGARVHELATRRATLEEAFLAATGLAEEYRGAVGDPAHDGRDGGDR
jgi:ABC-2 type transport system ATP-binding protein